MRDEFGPTSIEYGLIASLISVMCIGAATVAGQQLLAVYNNIWQRARGRSLRTNASRPP